MYTTVKNALLANGYALESATRLAKRFSRRADPIAALNEYLSC